MPLSDDQFVCNRDGSIYHLALHPGDLATTIILVGDPERVPKVSHYFDTIELKRANREIVTHTGTYKNKRFSVVSTGMGTDNVDIVLTEIDALFNVDFQTKAVKSQSNLTSLTCVRIGTSGGLQEAIPVGEVVASKSAIGFDGLLHCYKIDYSDREKALMKAITLHSDGFSDGGLLPYAVDGSADLLAQFSDKAHVGITATCTGFYGPQGRQIRLKPQMPTFLDSIKRFNFDTDVITNFEMETSGLYGLGKALGHQCLSLSVVIANRSTGEFLADTNKQMGDLITLTLDRLV